MDLEGQKSKIDSDMEKLEADGKGAVDGERVSST